MAIRIILMGTSEFAVPCFERVLNDSDFEVVGVFTQPDRPSGRGNKIKHSPVKDLLLADFQDIPIFQPESMKTQEISEFITSLSVDMIFIVSYGHILPERILTIPKYGCVNLHASALPLLRGSSPLEGAILQGLDKTGVTFFKLSVGVDDGDIIWQETVPLKKDETCIELHDHLAQFGANLVCKRR